MCVVVEVSRESNGVCRCNVRLSKSASTWLCVHFHCGLTPSTPFRSSGQRQGIKEREEEGRGWEVLHGCAVDVSDTHFCPALEREPGSPVHTHTHTGLPFQTGVGSWQGMEWCGGQPGCDRGGAHAAQDKPPLFATFWESERGGRRGGLCCQQRLFYPPPLTLPITPSAATATHLLYQRQMWVCVCL